MVNILKKIIQDHQLTDLLLQGQFGLEKENIRIDSNGHMALTPHPTAFADKSGHPFITTDFAESQIELITPKCQSTKEALNFIETLQDVVSLELKDEYLWPYSQPPILPDDINLIKEAQFADESSTPYRNYLSEKYGKYHQLLSGVHFNFSLTDGFLKTLHQHSQTQSTFKDFCNSIYLKMARFYLEHSWLVIYLTGFGNLMHQSYAKQRQLRHLSPLGIDALFNPNACSLRSGTDGYQNLKYFKVSYNHIDNFIQDIKQAITDDLISEPREYYSQLRLKGIEKTASLDDLARDGIHYLEIRSLDLNPTEASGISQQSLDFLHLFLIYGLLISDGELCDQDYHTAFENQLIAADNGRNPDALLTKRSGQTIAIGQWAEEILANMTHTFNEMGIDTKALNLLNIPDIAKDINDQGYQHYFLNLAKQYHQESHTRAFQLRHYEDLELSTQILLTEVIKQGIEFHFLDRQDHFIELQKGSLIQWVKQATKTALDSYICMLAMENKCVTKAILKKIGFTTAHGTSFINIGEAIKSYHEFQNTSIVIKPNSTNFGTGITILKTPFNRQEFEGAIEFAFQYDQKVLIEHFFPGKEYRFLIIDNQAAAVLYREAANVVGNGQDSIGALVKQKNSDLRRGENHRAPLEKIKLGTIEQQFLSRQQLTLSSIPKANQKVYLRENSNISTGGDSIDFSDTMPQSYKELAIEAANSVNAAICGVDMIISDIGNENPDNNYCIIELNFNPAIQMHTYPFIGKDPKIAKKILQALKLIPL